MASHEGGATPSSQLPIIVGGIGVFAAGFGVPAGIAVGGVFGGLIAADAVAITDAATGCSARRQDGNSGDADSVDTGSDAESFLEFGLVLVK
jgi:hypothetical protein